MTDVVLDLGEQPAADHFPAPADPGPDPVFPLRMLLCRGCGLAQLAEDPTVPDEPRAVEPQALRDQAVEAVGRLVAAGVLRPGDDVLEFGSPHGGSWEVPLTGAGLRWRGAGPDGPDEPAAVVVDVFGLMHDADQRAALARRTAAVAPGGVLLVQVHSLATILAQGQWNALRHGHTAYYSVPALVAMAADVGWVPTGVGRYALYGGTVLLELRREGDRAGDGPPAEVAALRRAELDAGVCTAAVVSGLGAAATERVAALQAHLAAARASGRRVLGYGAASRAVALLAAVDAGALAGVVDASPAKQGRCLPGSRVPVVAPEVLRADPPDEVLLMVPDLLAEVRAAYPEVEARGGSWTVVDELGRTP
ncbi:class I SAM-dependent methyltransferase [Rhodococcus aerolatus]